MRPNSLKAKLKAGQRVVGALITINSPELVETFGHLGYDFVFLDGQHGGLTVETARELIRAAELTGMTPLVRVRKNDPADARWFDGDTLPTGPSRHSIAGFIIANHARP